MLLESRPTTLSGLRPLPACPAGNKFEWLDQRFERFHPLFQRLACHANLRTCAVAHRCNSTTALQERTKREQVARRLGLRYNRGGHTNISSVTSHAMKTAPGTTVIRNGQLVDGTGAPPVADAAVMIEDGRITYAGPALGLGDANINGRIGNPSYVTEIDARGG